MQVKISGTMEKTIREAVRSGKFRSPEEYIAHALRDFHIQQINKALAVGMQQLERGEGVELDLNALIAELDAEQEAK